MRKKSGRFAKFMNHRYGTDKLYFFLFTVLMVVLFVNLMADSAFLAVISVAILIYMLYRAFSLDHKKRRIENERYLKLSGKVKAPVLRLINRYKLRNIYTFSKCRKCSAVIYAPKENKVTRVSCSRCGAENVVRRNKKRKKK